MPCSLPSRCPRRFVTIDASRRAIPVLNTDPMLSKCPIVGVWLKPGAACVLESQLWFSSLSPDRQALSSMAPLVQWCFGQADVWAQCLRFLHGACGHTVSVAPQTLLFVVFPPVHSPLSTDPSDTPVSLKTPEFYECTSCPPPEDESKQIHPLVRSFREDLTVSPPWPASLDAYASIIVDSVIDASTFSTDGAIGVVSSKGGAVRPSDENSLRIQCVPELPRC